MNFTREPIIETIISPKEGFKIVIRNSKAEGREEYIVDAVEVVSFGSSFFFRSLDRAKGFLVPVCDYEVVEVKEARVVLKNVAPERAIKIGPKKEIKAAKEEMEEETPALEVEIEQQQQQKPIDKKRDRRKMRKRRSSDERADLKEHMEKTREQHKEGAPADQGGAVREETPFVSTPTISTLFPPPPTLISETLSRYKAFTAPQTDLLPEPVESNEHVTFEPMEEKEEEQEEKKEHHHGGGESTSMNRSHLHENRSFGVSMSTPLPSSLVNENNFLS